MNHLKCSVRLVIAYIVLSQTMSHRKIGPKVFLLIRISRGAFCFTAFLANILKYCKCMYRLE